MHGRYGLVGVGCSGDRRAGCRMRCSTRAEIACPTTAHRRIVAHMRAANLTFRTRVALETHREVVMLCFRRALLSPPVAQNAQELLEKAWCNLDGHRTNCRLSLGRVCRGHGSIIQLHAFRGLLNCGVGAQLKFVHVLPDA